MSVRKLIKNGRGSYYINIPKETIKELKWRERQKINVIKRGSRVIIADWVK